ncbi:hypothetical protein HP532_00335 [Pseudomonas sp. CrR25]|nr:hypothetical protein [Pseudomonas sp. CrR25]
MTFSRRQFTAQLDELFARHGHAPYGEAISQSQHALQCATLAERDAFLRAPFAAQAMALRRPDDLDKDLAMHTPSLEHVFPSRGADPEQAKRRGLDYP